MISVIFKRYLELLLGCIGFSLVFAYYETNSPAGDICTTTRIFIAFLIVLFMIYNGYMIRHLYLKTYDSFEYYFWNFISVIMFLGTVSLFWVFLNKVIYTWLFSFVNIFYHMFRETGYVWSSVLFYVMIAVLVFVSKIYYDRKVSR